MAGREVCLDAPHHVRMSAEQAEPCLLLRRRELVLPLSLAAAAVGADGIIVEVHPNPDEAICDGPQALRADDFASYALAVEQAAELAGKALSVA